MVPTVEDVFHADNFSTDDYLGEIQSMTILTAIQVWSAPAPPAVSSTAALRRHGRRSLLHAVGTTNRPARPAAST